MKSLSINQQPLKRILFILAILIPLAGFSQTEGSGNIEQQVRPLSSFNKIEVGSAFTVYLSQGDAQVIVEADDNINSRIETTVKNGVLEISSTGIKNPTALRIYITSPNITDIRISGAARLESKGVLAYPVLNLSASGASRVNVELDTKELESSASGASRVILRGNAISHNASVSGASSVNALMLKTVSTTTNVSGAGKMSVFAKNQITTDISGAGSVNYFDNPDVKRVRQTGNSVINLNNPDDSVPNVTSENLDTDIEVRVFEDGDSTMVKLGKIKVRVHEDDQTNIDIGNHKLEINEEGNVKWKRNRTEKYDGHWGGFDMGINGLLTSDNSMDLPENYEFLDLKMEKSINVALNLFEQNFNLISDKVGITTGLGLEWNNYRMKDNVVITDLNEQFDGFADTDVTKDYIKSKLVTTYLTLPVILEFQTNRFSKLNSFHIGVGVLSGLRIGTHSKLVQDNGKKDITKDRGATSMNPFKFDLTARVGWGKINLYANYALVSLFKDNRGPELYPFAVGITLLSW